ncbi:NADH dehydrogenase [ubiquinone] 1 beta subcomplex subunit 4-like [Pteronotus mesoamericanus]|uniref:NADH dehydrogenase [ubiquinone] 1 beta subcomplex subunit 4-like n=1 Tax=Pteronotus mesoamericanus TaxID=1884717 RepID=UPI0023EC98F3|nr:NADH dehydrogenase [ubiquinone] 1 beta subcomplex subunit 4-like [Pteronotus parnellii mesoamericanus]
MSFLEHKPSCLATLFPTFDPAQYSIFLGTRKVQAKSLAIRLWLKREYLLQYNNARRRRPIKNPALTRWTYARSATVYSNFRPTLKTSFLGAVTGIDPLFFWHYVFKTDRDMKEKHIQEEKLD